MSGAAVGGAGGETVFAITPCLDRLQSCRLTTSVCLPLPPALPTRFYWQCKETSSLPAWEVAAVQQAIAVSEQNQAQPLPEQIQPGSRLVDGWGQCGGITGHPEGKDAAWPLTFCPSGFDCVRQDA